MAPYPVLVLQNDPVSGLGYIEDALTDLGLKARVLEMWQGDRVPSTISGYRNLVVLGGPQAAYDAPHVAYLREEMRAIREAAATRTPVLGVCLGAQLIAHALGGRAYRGTQPELGWGEVRLTPEGREDRVLRHLPDPAVLFQFHGDTFDLPAGARLLATSAEYRHQAFALPHDVYGLQFHLEWTPAIIERTLNEDAADYVARGIDPERVLREAPERLRSLEPIARNVFAAFFIECGCND